MPSTRSADPGWPRYALVIAGWLAYLATWPWGHGSILHDTYLAWALVPLLAGAWFYGRRLATPTALAFIPMQSVLFLATDHAPGWESVGQVEGLFGQMAIVVVTFLTGVISDDHRRLAEMLRSRDAMVTAVSHEVRTPLTAVVGIAQELGQNWSTLPDPTRQELVGLIAEQATDMTAIVEDLLTAARVSQGTLSVDPEAVDLATEAESIRHQLRLECPPVEGMALAWADPQRVRQVLRNLLVNARRYGGRQVVVRCGREAGRVWVEVRDNGRGMPPDQLAAAFRGETVRGDHADSNGLGLAFSRRLAVMMGGSLTYRREEGDTVFRLSLPRALGPITPGSSPSRAAALTIGG